jgi:hypothetical protein
MARVDDRVRPRVPPAIRRCDCGGFPPSLASPGLLWVLRAPSPHQYLLGGCPLVGNSLPRVYPLSDDRPGVPPLVFRSYFLFILYNHDFIGLFENCRINICKIKYLKNTRPCKTSRAVDPAKRDLKRTNIELAMLDFRPGQSEQCQLTARIDGIDRAFLFGNARLPPLAFGEHSIPPHPRGYTGKQGLSPGTY